MTRRAILTAIAIVLVTAVGMSDTEIVARYSAGEAGDPVPDPTSPNGGNWKVRVPSAPAGAVSNDTERRLNAWKITDRSEQPKSGRSYYIPVTDAQIAMAKANGWRLHVRLRMVDDFKDTASQVLVYDNGTRRWVLFFDLDGKGDLVVTQQHSSGNITHSLTTGSTGKNAYHDFELVYDPVTKTADFIADKKLIKKGDAGKSSPYTNKEVVFGTGSSIGRGEANWNFVQLEILGIPAEGLEIVKKGPFGFSVQLNRKEIYFSRMADVSIHKSYQNLGGFNVDVLYEYSGGNICQAFTYRVIRWKLDGTHSVSGKFGNCQVPQITREGDRLFFAFDSYTKKISGEKAPAQKWEYFDGELKQMPTPEPHPKIILESPEEEAKLSQGYDSSSPYGYEWNFSWKPPSDVRLVKHYEFRITNSRLEEPYINETAPRPNFTMRISKPIEDNRLEGWTWQVRAHYRDGTEGDWSTRKFSVAEYIPNTTIEGVVIDTIGRHLSGVTVTETVSGKTVLSGRNGRFRIGDLTPDTQATVTFNKDGYLSQSLDIALKLGSNPVSPKLSPAAELSCTVTDQSGNPVWGASIEVTGTQISAETQEGGICTISDLPANTQLEIIFTLVGYQTESEIITLNQGTNSLSVAMTQLAFIRGFVTDASGQPIVGAVAAVEGTDKSCLTGETGYYKVQFFTPGTQVTVTFSKDGYLSKSEQITLQYGDNLLPSVILNLPASVSGTVYDTEGSTLSTVTVTVEGTDISTLTGDDGTYTISELSPNDQVNIIFHKHGYADKSEQITLQPGDNPLPPVNLDLLASVSGVITDSERRVLEGVTVAVKGTDIHEGTGYNGYYEISNLTPNVQITITFSRSDCLDKSEQVTLQPGEDKDLSLSLDLLASVSGAVTDIAGAHIEEVQVTIKGTSISTSTDELGKYEISNLKASDQVTLEFSKQPYIDEIRTITLDPGNNTPPPVILYLPTSASGTVKSQITGNAIKDVTVKVEGTSISTSTRNDGSYDFSNVRAGTPVKITFSHTHYKAKTEEHTLQTGNNSLPQVNLIPKPVKTTLPPSPRSAQGSNNPEIVITVGQGLEYKVVGEWQGRFDKLIIYPSITSDYEKNKKIFGVYVKTISSGKNIALFKREKKYGRWSSWSLVARNQTWLRFSGWMGVQFFFQTTFKDDTGMTAY